MPITLSKPHEQRLQDLVDAGTFPSLDAAVGAAVELLIVEDDLSDDELDWLKPSIDEAVAQLDRGEVHSHEELFGRISKKLAALK